MYESITSWVPSKLIVASRELAYKHVSVLDHSHKSDQVAEQSLHLIFLDLGYGMS